jgi:preprotein translocase subunit SecD
MKKILLLIVVIAAFVASSCKKNEGAHPYDPATKITVDVNPKVISFVPATGKKGDTVTITGINFTTATSVTFGSMPATSFKVLSATIIKAVIGEGTSGTISVTNTKGTRALAGFIYVPPIIPALNKPATASTSFNDPHLSVDGDLGTRWSSLNFDNQWYKVDLQAVKKVNRVDIKWEGAYASDYALQISTDDITYTTIFSTTTSTGGNVSHSFTTVEARYVKILLNKRALPYPCSFYEFEVYNDPPPVNLALNKTATGSTNFNDPHLSVDGDVSTRWSSLNFDNQWYKVDLASTQTVGRVDIKWEGAYASDYALQVSTDDVNYTTVFSTTTSTGGDVSHTFTPVDARYVKILLNIRALPYPFSFYEFEVYKK